MYIRKKIISLAIIIVAGAALGAAARGQTPPVKSPHTTVPDRPATTLPVQGDRDVAAIQEQLIKLLRQSPTLTLVVARDPSLLANHDYVAKNNPQLAEFLTAHPEVALSPDYYLFNNLKRDGEGPDVALQRAAWPEMYRGYHDRTGWDELASDLPPTLGIGAFFITAFWIIRVVLENRRWGRIFKLQSDVHGRLIDKFSSNQELAAYMETEAGKRFLEAAPIPMNFGSEQRVPNAVARVLTPVQVGVVLVLLGIGFLLLRHAGQDMETPMLVLGTLTLMPGIGFIISAGLTWALASRLGLMPPNGPQPPSPAGRFDAPFGSTDRQ
jgi:hypothetical protein